MKNILVPMLLCFLTGQFLIAQQVEILENPDETLIVINADVTGGVLVNATDAGGGLAAYPSTFPFPFQHFADRVSLFSNAFTATGLDLRADGNTSDIRFYTGGLFPQHERMRITNDGRVGIGTASPLFSLDVSNLTPGQSARSAVNANDASGGVAAYSHTFPFPFSHFAGRVSLLSDYSNALGLDIRADGTNSDIRFYTGGALISNERMRITKYGRVGIGTTTPLQKLHVVGTIFGDDQELINAGVFGHGAIGVFGIGPNYGVYGESDSGTAVYYSGDLAGTGSKSAIVKTEDGPKTVYCQESPENWFEDFGSATTQNGKAFVSIAPDFLQTVTISDQYPMKVFVTPNANLGNWWVEKRNTNFILHAPDAKDGDAFDYRIVAKRKGFETLRLETFEGAYTDRYLYPTVDDVPDEYKEAWLKMNEQREYLSHVQLKK